MKKSILAMVLIGLLLTTTLVAVPQARAALPPQDGPIGVSHDYPNTEFLTTEYWTEERMAAAQPDPFFEREQGNGTGREYLAQEDGAPMYVQGNPPGGAAQSLISNTLPGASPSVQTLVGTYPFAFDRTSVPWTSLYMVFPWATNGKLFYTQRGTDYVCSGTSVTGAAGGLQNLVLTAAHCLHDGSNTLAGWSYNVFFVPGRRDGMNLNGYWAGASAWVTNSFFQTGNLRQDFGFINTAANGCGQLAACVGAQGIAWNQSARQQVWAFGYAAAAPFAGETMYVCTSTVAHLDTLAPGSGPYPMGIGCDLTNGVSGGGWLIWNNFLNAGYANSVFSYKITNPPEPSAAFGPYFNSSFYCLWQDARVNSLVC